MLPTKFNWMKKKPEEQEHIWCLLPANYLVSKHSVLFSSHTICTLTALLKKNITYVLSCHNNGRSVWFLISHRTRNYKNKLPVPCTADIVHDIMINTYSKLEKMEVTGNHRSRDTVWTCWVKEMVFGQWEVFVWLVSNFSWRSHEKFFSFWCVKQQWSQGHLKT